MRNTGGFVLGIACGLGMALSLSAAENLPEKPFGQAVWLPKPREWWVTPWYQYSEFQEIWRGGSHESITVPGEHGFDQNDGMVLIEYGIKKDWAADLLLGYTSLATRSFTTPYGAVQTTQGLMDVNFGIRWQLLNETNETATPFSPTLTLRVGGIFNGTYENTFPFAPGNGSVGIEPSALLFKSFGWQGFGMYANLGYRSMRSGGNSQVFGSAGFSQAYKGFNFDTGYRHQQDTSGVDIGGTGNTIVYSVKARERNEYFEAGIGYTDHHNRHYQFYLTRNFDGRNAGDKTIYGIYATFPFGP